jgi:hypothetical protein
MPMNAKDLLRHFKEATSQQGVRNSIMLNTGGSKSIFDKLKSKRNSKLN